MATDPIRSAAPGIAPGPSVSTALAAAESGPGLDTRSLQAAPALGSRRAAVAVGGVPNVGLQLAQPLAASNGAGPEPYRVLKQLFERAQDPVALSDIEAVDARAHHQKCVKATSTTRTQDALVDIDLWSAVSKKTTPSGPRGPLFPADTRPPPKGYVGFGPHGDAEHITYDKLKVTTTATEIMTQVFSDEPKPYHQNRVRKSGDLVAFEFAWPNGASRDVDYGYCWRE